MNLAWRTRRVALRKLVRPLILAPENWTRSELIIEMSEAIRERIHVLQASGNRFEILFHLLTESQNSKSIFEWKEYLKMPFSEDDEQMKEINKKLEKLKEGIMCKIQSQRLEAKG